MEYLSIPHYRGLKEKYDEQKHGDGIFFTTDTHEIIANNATYGETIDTWSIADGVLTLTMTSGKTLKITFDEATESAKGFLSAEDKKKINSLEGNFDKKVDKVPGKSLVDDTEIDKLSNLPNKADLDSAIADAKKAGTDAQTNLTAHIGNKDNPHEVTKVQVGLGNVTNDAQVKRSEMGTASGVATLDENGLVPSSQLPSFVDDVLEFDLKDNFPTTGETGKIYVAKDSNLTYRWSGTQYVEISASLALGETSSTAYAGDKGKDVADKLAKVRNTQLSHIKDTDTFSATAEKVSLNYDCYVGDQYGAEATSHSVDIPVASETQAGIVTAEDKKAITNLDTTYAKKADIDKSIKDLSDSIATGETNAIVSLAENSPTAYAKSYVLSQGNKQIGTINIPKDMVVSSGSLKTVTSADNPYTGAKVGDKYIDLVISNVANDHIYIPVSDLIDTYLAGNGLTLEDSTFSIKKDETSEDYLTVGTDGVKVSGVDKALEGKVDKEEGKSLVLTTEITKLAGLPDKASLEESISDAKKVGDAAQSNLNAHIGNTQNPHNVTKAQLKLGNVDNTSDKDKPVSDATQLALNKKVDKVDGKSLTSNDFTNTLKTKLDGIAENANNYSLPTASETTLGGVIVDSALNSTSTNPVQNRVIYSTIDEINGKLSWAKID